MDLELSGLIKKIADFISAKDSSGSESLFDSLALEVFNFQYRRIEPYRRMCDRIGVTPSRVTSWTHIPAVSTRAFRLFRMFSGEDKYVARIFKSSGTTDPALRSRAYFSRAGLEVMDLAIMTNAAKRFFPDGRSCRLLVLGPDPAKAPDSIMSYGMSRLVEKFGLEGSGFLACHSQVDLELLLEAVNRCVAESIPVAIMGSSFACLNFFEFLAARDSRLALSSGSRLLHAGGFKGRTREIPVHAFVAMASVRLGLAPERVVNLLGMTELASQIYDQRPAQFDFTSRSGDSHNEPAFHLKAPPKWMRTLIVDPRLPGDSDEGSLMSPVEKKGILRHFDLANIERPLAVQSEDLAAGRLLSAAQGHPPPGYVFEILGRAELSEPRGCSLSSEDLCIGLAAATTS